jgi:NAD(P)-dependent dehydrogenase (short-subunit alcohol dehydrogenase family)
MPSVLITGANRGIGLEFARQYAADRWEVIATARSDSPELDALGVRVEQLDMRDLGAVATFGSRLAGVRLDLLIANAGTDHPKRSETAEDAEAWTDMLAINSVAPFMLARGLLEQMRAPGGKLIAMSSRMGSIANNGSGGYVPYRTSKAALNAAWRSLAIDVRPFGLIAAMFHPGWVKTRMGGPNAPLPPEKSIASLRRLIEGLEPGQSGGFLDYDGTVIPW